MFLLSTGEQTDDKRPNQVEGHIVEQSHNTVGKIEQLIALNTIKASLLLQITEL